MTSEEFSSGTIKLLLIKPYKRTKIILSKYIVTLTMICIAIIFAILFELGKYNKLFSENILN